ncbi:serum response factor-binding protein 1 isoform X2 [Dunckerocampus dactyliophorus]|nr:serum response factor-binding protein 1 isoform X2 [Dunckerocampus dactyliophorus]
MISPEDKFEEVVPNTDEEEKGEVGEQVEVKEDNQEEKEHVRGEAVDEQGHVREEEDVGGEAKQDSEGEDSSKEMVAEQSTNKHKKPVQTQDKKQPGVLNLNNEVVNMRKEMKRVRVLVTRKLTRQIAALRKKKGKEADIERNQRRASRLIEEIHAMKILQPDLVTKTALQKTLNFEQVCKNPKSTMSDRAVARIASHPQFNKKIENIKAAVKAFRDDRRKAGKQEERSAKVKKEDGKPLQAEKVEKMVKGENVCAGVEEMTDTDEGALAHDSDKDTIEQEVTVTDEGALAHDSDKDTIEQTQAAPAEKKVKKDTQSLRPASVKEGDFAEQVKKPQAKSQENKSKLVPELPQTKEEVESDSEISDDDEDKPDFDDSTVKPKPLPELTQTKRDDQSDSEISDDEDKPYFDDSTEERFHKQSSQSEGSDSDNDFFVGKVSKFKKKKKNEGGKVEVHARKEETLKPADKIQSELDELESRLKAKAPKLQTVFCSLSQSKPRRGRGGNSFRGREKPMGRGSRDNDKHSRFQKQEKGTTDKNPDTRRLQPEETTFRGRGRGRGNDRRQHDRRGGSGFSHQAPQQALHPSWEASKKRKEQQGQILAFQGKKIKFDDDD